MTKGAGRVALGEGCRYEIPLRLSLGGGEGRGKRKSEFRPGKIREIVP